MEKQSASRWLIHVNATNFVPSHFGHGGATSAGIGRERKAVATCRGEMFDVAADAEKARNGLDFKIVNVPLT